jgi:hypothetical protein
VATILRVLRPHHPPILESLQQSSSLHELPEWTALAASKTIGLLVPREAAFKKSFLHLFYDGQPDGLAPEISWFGFWCFSNARLASIRLSLALS